MIVDRWESRWDRLERALCKDVPTSQIPELASESPDVKSSTPHNPSLESPKKRFAPDHRTASSSLSSKPVFKESRNIGASPSGSYATTGTDSSGLDSAVTQLDVNDRNEHTTAAHKLLRWPSIWAVFTKSRKSAGFEWDSVHDYVMKLEQEQGVLRVHGRGEAQTTGEGGYPGSPAGSTVSGRSEETAEGRSPPSGPEDLWGFGPADNRSKGDAEAVDRGLHLDPGTLRHLLNSYLENIHVLHPFINKHRITQLFRRFSLRYNPSDHQRKWTEELFGRQSSAKSLDGSRESASSLSNSTKRKRSTGQFQNLDHEVNPLANQSSHQPPLERSPETAMILLIMALGKICDWKKPIPGPVSSDNKDIYGLRSQFSSPRPVMTDSPSSLSVRQSPASSVQPTAAAKIISPTTGGSIASSSMKPVGEDPPPALRNIDVIPGLVYYALATDILGNCHNGHELIHAQMFLLAGLYAGQLARGFESFGWIHSASRVCMYLVRE